MFADRLIDSYGSSVSYPVHSPSKSPVKSSTKSLVNSSANSKFDLAKHHSDVYTPSTITESNITCRPSQLYSRIQDTGSSLDTCYADTTPTNSMDSLAPEDTLTPCLSPVVSPVVLTACQPPSLTPVYNTQHLTSTDSLLLPTTTTTTSSSSPSLQISHQMALLSTTSSITSNNIIVINNNNNNNNYSDDLANKELVKDTSTRPLTPHHVAIMPPSSPTPCTPPTVANPFTPSTQNPSTTRYSMASAPFTNTTPYPATPITTCLRDTILEYKRILYEIDLKTTARCLHSDFTFDDTLSHHFKLVLCHLYAISSPLDTSF